MLEATLCWFFEQPQCLLKQFARLRRGSSRHLGECGALIELRFNENLQWPIHAQAESLFP